MQFTRGSCRGCCCRRCCNHTWQWCTTRLIDDVVQMLPKNVKIDGEYVVLLRVRGNISQEGLVHLDDNIR